ncbi:MAG: DUF3843 family protein [Chloroflexi bacterium]|nr:DUF3843 family protein [Chloroflexota bacterium]
MSVPLFGSHRPPGRAGKCDRHLPQLAQELEQLLTMAEDSLAFSTLRLPGDDREELAGVLAEFAEDVRNGIGIWDSLEQHNIEFFGTRLPLVLRPGEDTDQRPVNEHRLQHLLWVMYSELKPELLLSPTHQDLKLMAATVSTFLRKRFAGIPRGSAVKAFLGGPNTYGWEVKRKLIWLGTHSYLFRSSFLNYVEKHGKKPEVPIVDDFLCQQTTAWSGLGAIDILAGVLDITPEQRATLRGWFDRHTAIYQVLAVDGLLMKVVNKICDKPYTVRRGNGTNPFEIGQVVLGSLVPWNGEWYWSGQQWGVGKMPEDQLQKMKDSFLKDSPLIAYRYCDELAEKARASLNLNCRRFLDYHGDDLAVYPDGVAMAGDRQKEMRLQWESHPPEVVAKAMDKFKLPNPWPSASYPQSLLESKNGVGVYCNTDEGDEVMTGFNDIISGLKKRGAGLTRDEQEAIREFVGSDSISPAFVRRMVREYGHESIEAAFLIRGESQDYHLDYLLRQHKGEYYRKRYPRITLV